MIVKIWNVTNRQYDAEFDRVSDNAWEAWINDGHDYIRDVDGWKKRFHCIPIIGVFNGWDGLIFENESDYMLFLLEWS